MQKVESEPLKLRSSHPQVTKAVRKKIRMGEPIANRKPNSGFYDLPALRRWR